MAVAGGLRLGIEGGRVTLAVLAVEQAGSVALGGVLIAALLAPSVVIAPLAGVLFDRSRSPGRLLVGAGGVTAVGLALSALLGILPAPVVVVVLIITGCCAPAFMGALSAFAADVIPDRERAFAADAFAYNASGVAGPALAALAMTVGSSRLALGAFAVIALTAAGVAATMPLPARPRPTAVETVLTDVGRGLRHMVAHRPLAVATLASTLTMVGAGAFPIAAVGLALERLGTAGGAGWILTAFALGGLVGALLIAWRPVRRVDPTVVMLAAFAATGVGTVVAGLLPGYAAALAAVAVAGLFTAPGITALFAIRQRESPSAVRSQVFTVGAGLRTSAGAVGAAIGGAVAGIGGGPLTVLVGVVWLVSAALLLLPGGLARAGGRARTAAA
ncbi:MAG: transporter [Naasia sp.]|nr:transporter [Naasia sp.]